MINKQRKTVGIGKGAPGPGRIKGVPNKATREAREVIARVAESTAEEVEGWLRSVAADDPAKALDLWLKLLEYHIPKLARTELTGADGGPVQTAPVLNIVLNGMS